MVNPAKLHVRAEVVHETDRAYLTTTDLWDEVWVPKSRIEETDWGENYVEFLISLGDYRRYFEG